jgi:exonuclease SbcC
MERELRRLPALQGREAHLREALREAEGLASDLKEQRQQLGSLRQALAGGEFAKEDQKRLAAMAARIAQLGYDQMVHDQVRSAMQKLKGFEEEKAHLNQAEQSLVELRSSQEQLLKAKEQRAAALASDQEHEAELRTALAGFEELTRDLEAKQQEADDLRGREGHARQAVGAAQQKLDSCRYWARERKERVAQQKTLAEERGLYEELRTAFGKRGLQALIIESAIPEVEDDANELLSRMTDGRMTLHFETQRDTKAGSTIETLDIKISDEYGSRSYEMYSGGEAFRINFAIRIALSKMLARRAGARLQTLIIDEGFGTQDADGRQKLVEAINSIKDDFALILVITHIEELKDAFPVRIDVYKTPAGSQISIG